VAAESKSLKLYLGSFRNIGAFHEDCTVAIGKQLVALLKPKWLRIGGYWYRAAACRSTCSAGGKLPRASGCRTRGRAHRGRGEGQLMPHAHRSRSVLRICGDTSASADDRPALFDADVSCRESHSSQPTPLMKSGSAGGLFEAVTGAR
jgi:hypothetical protein